MLKRAKIGVTMAAMVAALAVGGATGATPASAGTPTSTKPGTLSPADRANATAAAIVLNNFTSVETAAHHNMPDNRISHNDLYAASQWTSNRTVANAANRILRYPGLERQLDTAAHGGSADGRISRNDLRAYIDKHGH